jgi:hypothetical protein
LLAAGALAASGCEESEHPPCRAAAQAIGAQLAGRWAPEDELGELVIIPEKERVSAVIIGHGFGTPPEIDVRHFGLVLCQGKMAEFGALTARSVLTGDKPAEREVYIPFRYEVKDSEFRVSFPTYNAYERAVARRALHGEAWQTTWGENAIVRSSSAELAQWLKGLGPESFTQPRVYRRPKR